jgi:hypothetical protein
MRNLMVLPAGTGGSEASTNQADYEFHEQVYAWEPKGIDVWGSIRSSTETEALRALLFDTFSPSPATPVSKRSIGGLKSVLDALTKVLGNPGQLEWADSQDFIEADSPEPINMRANTIAVLYNHLLWIYEVFGEVPGASVSIR